MARLGQRWYRGGGDARRRRSAPVDRRPGGSLQPVPEAPLRVSRAPSSRSTEDPRRSPDRPPRCELAEAEPAPSSSPSTSSRSTGRCRSTPTSPSDPRRRSASSTWPRRSPRTPACRLESVLVQARDVGAAIVDEAAERDADLLVLGPAVPHALRRRLRDRPDRPLRLQERAVRGVGGARADARGASHEESSSWAAAASARRWPRPSTADGHEVIDLDSRRRAFDRLPAHVHGRRRPRRRHGRGRPPPRRRRGRRPVPGADRGRQPQRHGRPAGVESARRSDRVVAKINDPVRAAAYAELGIVDDLPDDPDGRRASLAFAGLPSQRRAGRSTRRAATPTRSPSRHAAPRRPGRPACPVARPGGAERCSCSSSAAARSATT